MRPIIYLLDDDPLALWTLQTMVAEVDAEVRSFDSAQRFIQSYRPSACECLVMDLEMPEASGLDVQQWLREHGAVLPIIFVSGRGGVRTAVTAMQHGALDFLEKPVHAEVLLERVRRALERSIELDAARRERAQFAERLDSLTLREREVAELVALGRSSREIAELLELSPRTVENHRARAMEKLGVESAIELVQCLNRARPAP